MDGIKILPLLPKNWLLKCLVWQQNRHQKVFYGLEGFTFVQWGLTFWNLNKHHCFIVLHI